MANYNTKNKQNQDGAWNELDEILDRLSLLQKINESYSKKNKGPIDAPEQQYNRKVN
jgi:hypothetical protein